MRSSLIHLPQALVVGHVHAVDVLDAVSPLLPDAVVRRLGDDGWLALAARERIGSGAGGRLLFAQRRLLRLAHVPLPVSLVDVADNRITVSHI